MKKIILYIANRLHVIIIIYLSSIIIAGILFSIIEDKTIIEGLWWAFVTALTIGYGDFAPATNMGRLVGVFFSHFWVFFIGPMIIANIIIHMLEDKGKFTDKEQEWLFKAVEQIAEKQGIKLDEQPPDY